MRHRSGSNFSAASALVGCAGLAFARPAPEVVGPPPAPFTQMIVFACGDPQCESVLGTLEKFGPPVSNAFAWTGGAGFTNLAVAASLPNLRVAMPSADGTAYVGTEVNVMRVHHWTPPAAPIDIGFLPGMVRATAVNISADGTKIAGVMSPTANGSGSRGFTWTAAGGLVDMNLPTGTSWIHIAWLSADGSEVIGDGFTPGGVRSVFRWTAGGGAVFLPPAAGFSFGVNVVASPDGQTIAGLCRNTSGPETMAVWRDGTVRAYGLPAVPYDALSVLGLSGDGRTIVGQMADSSNGQARGFVWKRNTGFLDVKPYLASLGWDVGQWNVLESVVGISEDGRTIVGRGLRNTTPSSAGWRAVNAIPPACDGDFDGNGSVNTADLTAFLSAFGSCPGAPTYRLHLNIEEADACITTADLVKVLAAFGQSCG